MLGVEEMAKIQVRLTELYACYTYLNTGYYIWVDSSSHIPRKFRREVIESMGLEYKRCNAGKRYFGSEDKIWKYFVDNYKEQMDKLHITNYRQLSSMVNINGYNI